MGGRRESSVWGVIQSRIQGGKSLLPNKSYRKSSRSKERRSFFPPQKKERTSTFTERLIFRGGELLPLREKEKLLREKFRSSRGFPKKRVFSTNYIRGGTELSFSILGKERYQVDVREDHFGGGNPICILRSVGGEKNGTTRGKGRKPPSSPD